MSESMRSAIQSSVKQLSEVQSTESFWPIAELLHEGEFIDLTHPFDEHVPHFTAFPPMVVTELFNVEKHGFWTQHFCHVGQWGTHMDPPAHLHKSLRTVDQIPVKEMLLPLVVIDVHKQVTKNPDYALSVADIHLWEEKSGLIPANSLVAMRSDWSKRWPDQVLMDNRDESGIAHYPGWSLEALEYIFEKRNIIAIGHETIGTDVGVNTSQLNLTCERYALKQNHYQVELLTNLDRVPAAGAIIVCAIPKVKNGSGFPARAFAIVPKKKSR